MIDGFRPLAYNRGMKSPEWADSLRGGTESGGTGSCVA